MIVVVLAAAILGAPGEEIVELSPPVAAVAVVLAPGQSAARSDTSSLLAAFSRAIEPHTDLRVSSPEQVGLSVDRLLACPPEARLSCWAREILALGAHPPRYLFVLSVSRRDGDTSLLSALLLDVEAASQLVGSADEVEGAIFDSTARTAPLALYDEATTAERLAQVELRPALERAGRWGRLGQVRIVMECGDCTVEVDGRAVATPRSGALVLARVPRAPHEISILRGGTVRHTERVELGASLERTLTIDPKALSVEAGVREAMPWVGAGASAAGGAALGVGLALVAARSPFACVVRRAEDGARCVDPSGDGAAVAAIGAGVLGLGVALLGASWLDEEGALPEWASIAIGVGLGAAGAVAIGASIP